MSETKANRTAKKQLGDFQTPELLTRKIVAKYASGQDGLILEPSFGKGAFLFTLADAAVSGIESKSDRKEVLVRLFADRIYGVEYQECHFDSFFNEFQSRYGFPLTDHNLVCGDFFDVAYDSKFDLVIGNPPFGGTFNKDTEDDLENEYGHWRGLKIKKETYSFFMHKCLRSLVPTGRLVFVCSDTFLTLNTMKGLRVMLLDTCDFEIEKVSRFSPETNYPIVVASLSKTATPTKFSVDGETFSRNDVERFPNIPFVAAPGYVRLFDKELIGDKATATSGMTTGRNELFVRQAKDGFVSEPYSFWYVDEPVSLQKQCLLARLGKLSPKRAARVAEQERLGDTVRELRFELKSEPLLRNVSCGDYVPYNKASSGEFFAPVSNYIFWKDDGDAVLTFKSQGPWYLHGVGGARFFKRPGLTWSLVGSTISPRLLDAGHILDSGAPCLFVDGDDPVELLFLLGWLSTTLATNVLKTCLNHTRNIQGKDVERLPFPWWVDSCAKAAVVDLVGSTIQTLRDGGGLAVSVKPELERLFAVV